jgi:hypothetical protein
VSSVGWFFLLLIGLPLVMILGTKVAQDLDRRGIDGRPYAVLFVLLPPVGVAVWLYFRLTRPVQGSG